MEKYRIIRLDSYESTNTYATALPVTPSDTEPVVVITDNQTAGRGQRGNTWESQPGKNLTFSLVMYPRFIAPARQFELSMLVSLGILNALRGLVGDPGRLKIKWPNDIYYGDRKIAGILIENSLTANAIDRTVIGIGLNVNQFTFVSDAPNPISMMHTTGTEFDLDAVLDRVVTAIIDMVNDYEFNNEPDELAYMYNTALWRNDGREHAWQLPDGTTFDATLDGVALDGTLRLRRADGTTTGYRFKEISPFYKPKISPQKCALPTNHLNRAYFCATANIRLYVL